MSSLNSATPAVANRGPEENNIKSTQGSSKAEQKALNDATSGDGPASLSANKKRVPRDKPSVRPPLANLTMQKFLTNLFLVVAAVALFYVWRITVWASDAGGYWNLMLGRGKSAAAVAGGLAAQGLASGVSKGAEKIAPTDIRSAAQSSYTAPASNLQAQIYALASSLGVKPADLSAAIAPLTDPTAPNPFREAEALKAKVEEVVKEKEAVKDDEPHLGLMGFVEEAFLD